MAHARCSGAFVLLCHAAEPPSDAEWQAYLDDAERWLPTAAGQFVSTDGGGPTSGQRRALRQMLGRIAHVPFRTAVVSGNLLVRGIVIAINLFNPQIRVFAPEALDAALKYLRVSPPERAFVLGEMEKLRLRLRE